MVAIIFMSQLKYTGRLKLKTEKFSSGSSSKEDYYSQSAYFVSDFYLSQKQLVKYKSNDYVFLLDGQIFEFDNQPFSDDHYYQIATQIARDPQQALRLINGEFVLFLIHVASPRMIVASSVSGNAALFYRSSSSSIVFSNSMNEIQMSEDETPTLRLQRIYDILTANNLGSAETCFSGIERLLPGHIMEIEKGRISLFDYSNLFQNFSRVSQVDDPYADFRDIFQHALKIRIKPNQIGIALSSGKDSTAVAAMAYSAISTHQEIKAYTFLPTLLPEHQSSDIRFNETILLNSLFEKYPGIFSNNVEVTPGSLLSSLERSLEIYGEPVYGISNQYWIQRMHEMMLQDKCETMLTGQGGNYTISWPPPELVAARPSLVRSRLRRLIRPTNLKPDLTYLTRDFINGVCKGHFLEGERDSDVHQLQPLLIKNSLSYSGYLQKQVSLYHGFQITDPTMDQNLIDFCLRMPFEVYHDEMNSRKLVTHGLRELLPEDIVANNIRSIQASDIQYRLQEERGNFVEKLEFLNNNKLVTFVLETEKLLKDWDSMDFSKVRRKELNHLLRLIQVGLFLSKYRNIV